MPLRNSHFRSKVVLVLLLTMVFSNTLKLAIVFPLFEQLIRIKTVVLYLRYGIIVTVVLRAMLL